MNAGLCCLRPSPFLLLPRASGPVQMGNLKGKHYILWSLEILYLLANHGRSFPLGTLLKSQFLVILLLRGHQNEDTVERSGRRWSRTENSGSRLKPTSNRFSGCPDRDSEYQGKHQSECIRDFGRWERNPGGKGMVRNQPGKPGNCFEGKRYGIRVRWSPTLSARRETPKEWGAQRIRGDEGSECSGATIQRKLTRRAG